MFFRKKWGHDNIKCNLSDQLTIFNIPKAILVPTISLLTFSILCLYSAGDGNMYPWAVKQLLYMFVSLVVFVIIANSDIRNLYKSAYTFLWISIFLLIITMFVGKRTMGASRWINFGYFKFQPSEFVKLAVILAIAKFFSRIKSENNTNFAKSTFCTVLLVAPVVTLVVIQPDLANAIIITTIFLVMLFTIGISKKQFVLFGLLTILATPLIWFKFLKEYQKLRIINFLFPENDPLGSGYNIIQSKIAIGSGGLTGKGYLMGTQGRLHFLPEHHTDFIFTNVGEEWGLIGSMVLILMYLCIVFYGFSVERKINSIFCKLIIVGCVTVIFVHMFVNIGMTTGLMPVAGIPLIMMSYGGSSLLLGISCIALIVNIDINQKNINTSKHY